LVIEIPAEHCIACEKYKENQLNCSNNYNRFNGCVELELCPEAILIVGTKRTSKK
jgi:hypothetical protein